MRKSTIIGQINFRKYQRETKINENTILGILNPMTRSYAGISFADPDYIFTPENTLIIPIGELYRY